MEKEVCFRAEKIEKNKHQCSDCHELIKTDVAYRMTMPKQAEEKYVCLRCFNDFV